MSAAQPAAPASLSAPIGAAIASPIHQRNPVYRRRAQLNRLMLALSMLALVFGLIWLVWIVGTLIVKGAGALSWTLFTQSTPPPGLPGGLLNAIAGSAMMVAVATAIGTPVGILAGTYLAEYGKQGWLAPATRFLNDVLLSAPSIVIGLFIYAVYVAQVGHYAGWAGSFALVAVRFWTHLLHLDRAKNSTQPFRIQRWHRQY